MTLTHIKTAIDRANELDMLSFVCADTIAEARAIAELHPDINQPGTNGTHRLWQCERYVVCDGGDTGDQSD